MINKKGMVPILISVVVFVLVVVLVVLAVFLFQKRKDADKEQETQRPTRTVTEPTRIDVDKVQSRDMDSDFREYLDEKKEGGKITFELFGGETFECNIDEVVQEAQDIKGIICSSDRFDAYFTFDDEIVLGTVIDLQREEGSYVIVSDSTTGKIVLEEYR